MFESIITSGKKKDIAMVEAVRGAIPKVLENPQCGEGWLKGPLRGKRKLYVGRSSYRLVFVSCEECRRNGFDDVNQCDFCSETDELAVVFFFAGSKKGRHDDYRL